jgi:WD40 repeat protein
MAVRIFTSLPWVLFVAAPLCTQVSQFRDWSRALGVPLDIRRDCYGDRLPDGAFARCGTVRFRQHDRINALAFSSNGRILAVAEGKSGGQKHCIRLWDVRHGRGLGFLVGHEGTVCALVFSPDGTVLASASNDKTVRFWKVPSGKELKKIEDKNSPFYSIVFSPDGKTVAAGHEDGAISLWDVKRGSLVFRLADCHHATAAVAFSPNGKALAAASKDGRVYLWDVETKKVAQIITADKHWLESVAYSPNGRMLASGGREGVIRLWDPTTGKALGELDHRAEIKSLAISPDGKLLISAGEREGGIDLEVVRVWDLATGKELRELRGHSDTINSVAFSRDGRLLASGGNDKTISLWEVSSWRDGSPADTHRNGISTLAHSPDAKTVATGSRDRTVRVWDARTGKQVGKFAELPGAVDCLAFSPDGTRLAASASVPYKSTSIIQIWDTATGRAIVRFEAHRSPKSSINLTTSMSFAPGGRKLYSAGRDGSIRVWDTATGKELFQIDTKPAMKELTDLSMSPDGTLLCVQSTKREVQVFEATTGKPRMALQCFEDTGYATRLLHGEVLLVGTSKGKLIWWDVRRDKMIRESQLDVHSCWFTFSPDGRWAWCDESFGTFTLWDLTTCSKVKQINIARGQSLTLSPDGKTIASTGSPDFDVLIWDVTGLCRDGQFPMMELSNRELKRLWDDLADANAPRSHRAVWTLVAGNSRTIAYFKEHLRPTPSISSATLTRLIAALDDEEYVVRNKAEKQLEEAGELAEVALRACLARQPSAQVRKSVEELITRLGSSSSKRLHAVRAIAVLEYLNSAEARSQLKALSKGDPHAWLTIEARAAYARLTTR